MIRRILFACVTPWLLITSAVLAEELQVGAAVRVITPDPLLPVSGGLGPTRPVKEKRGELTARAIVFRRGGVSVAVVSIDALGFPSVLADRVRAQVPQIEGRNILIGATHTHSAPCCYAFPDGRGGHTGDLAYIDSVCAKAAEAINEAIDNLRPAQIRVSTDEAGGKIAYNYYAPDLYDRRMSVIEATTPDGRTIATLVNYAVHPEVLGPGAGILSPDLVGPLCARIEQESGGVALFVNGAQGGMITADNRDLDRPRDSLRAFWEDHRTWDECLRIGHTMADEALRIVRDAPVQPDPTRFCDSLDVRFPVESDAIWNVVLHSPLRYPHNDDRSITARITLVNLGNAQIVTIPGEALPNVGFYLKRKMRGEHNLLFGLTNDAFGYILTKVDFKSFPRYDYVSRVSLGEQTGEILIERSLELVARSPAPDRRQEEAINRTNQKSPKGEEPPVTLVNGSVKAVDFARNRITIAVAVLKDGVKQTEDQRFDLAKDVPIFLDNRITKDEPVQPGNLSDLTDGTLVTLRLDDDQKTVLKVTAVGPDLGAMFKTVDASQNTITLTLKESGQFSLNNTYGIAKGVRVWLNDGQAVEGKLADLTEGTLIVARLSVERNTVLSIRVPGPTLDALWQGADSAKNTIAVTVKEGGKLVDKTFPLGKHSKIDPAAVPGGHLLLQFSAVDKSKVVSVEAVRDDDL